MTWASAKVATRTTTGRIALEEAMSKLIVVL